MNKKILTIVIFVIVLAVIIGVIFWSNSKNKNIQINIDELADKIATSGAFEDQLIKADSELVIKDYGFTNDEIKELVSYQGSGATSEEIVILQVKDKSNLNTVKEKINTRIDERKEAFASYLPKEVFKIENNVLKIEGNYAILCISNDAKKVSDVINNYIKE